MAGLRDIAAAAGVSVATVSRALRRQAHVKPETAALIERLARESGYISNPYAGQLMASVRRRQGSQFRGNLALIWVDHSPRDVCHEEMLRLQAGAHLRAEELGYSLTEFKRSDHGAEALVRILKNRGVQGLLFSPSYRSSSKIHLRLALESFSCVALGWAVAYPALHTVRVNHYQAMQLALHQVRRRYGKGIASIYDYHILRRSDHMARAAFLCSHPGGVSFAENVFFDHAKLHRKETAAAFRRYGIKCVIAQRDTVCPAWLDDLVPREDRVYLEKPLRPPPYFGWVKHGHTLVGHWGIELLSALVQRRESGVPGVPQITLAPPQWEAGTPM